MSEDDLRAAEEQRDAADAYLGHPWYALERDDRDEEADAVRDQGGQA